MRNDLPIIGLVLIGNEIDYFSKLGSFSDEEWKGMNDKNYDIRRNKKFHRNKTVGRSRSSQVKTTRKPKPLPHPADDRINKMVRIAASCPSTVVPSFFVPY